jgi:hypothetical protein
VDFDVLSLEPNEVTNIEGVSSFLITLVLFLHLFFQKSESGFGIGMDLCKIIKLLVQSRHIAALANRNGEVRTIAVD